MIVTKLLPSLLRRSSTRLLLTFGSLLIGALTLSVVLGLIGSVQMFFLSESRTLLGGDVTIEDDGAIDKSTPIIARLLLDGAVLSERAESLVVIHSALPEDKERLSSLLVSLKVVDAQYPLYGSLGLSNTDVLHPTENQVFVSPDILARMGVVVGDILTIGSTDFSIANVITSEPDTVGGSFRLGPPVIISYQGWARTGLDGKQSRIEHTLSLRYPSAMDEATAVATTESLRESFPRPKYRVAVASDGPSSLLRILDSAERFFFTMIVLALFLVVVNIRLNLTYFLASFQKTIAIMRSLGMRKGQLLSLFLTLLLVLALVAGALGGLLGTVLANIALPYAEQFVGVSLPTISPFDHVAVVTLFTFVLCFFSSLGFFVRILSIEPKMLLVGYGSAHGRFRTFAKELPLLLLTLLGLYGGVYYLTERALVALIAIGGIAGVFVVLFLLSRGAILLGHKLRFSLPFSLRSIANFLKHQGLVGTTAIASLTIALASVFSIALLEKNVLGNLSVEFKADAPNIYLIDIQDDQREGVRAIMGETWKDFSMVRARFTSRDGYDIQTNLDTENGELRREFNVTSQTNLIAGEKLIDGVWHGETGRKEVSVEKGFAERAKLTLGSRVQFSVSGFPIEATVTSIREVTTTNGLPFFFLVFSPDVLEGIPRTSFGYAFAAAEQIPVLQNKLAKSYPNITSIPTTQIIDAARRVVGALTTAVIATTIPSLFLGLLLIFAMLAISARERFNDMLVFAAYGARMRLLFGLFITESSAVVLLSSFFAGVLSHGGIFALNRYVFDFSGFYFSIENAYIFVGILAVTLTIALFFSRKFFTVSPAELLRKEGL